jgi:multiple antibiotic resistance protein
VSFDLFLSAFVSLFVIADPFGTAAVFSVLTSKIDRPTQQKIAFKAVCIAIGLLIGFSLVGNFLIAHMGISLAAFRTAGGFLLFITAFRMIMGFHDPNQLNSENSAYQDRSDIAVFPMAIPLLAGPGCITATLMFSTAAQNIFQHAEIWLAIIAVESLALVTLLGATRLSRVLGPTGNGVIARIMGILLAAMAVQFIVDGLKALGFALN